MPIHQRKLELENRLEEEKTRIELEKIKLEKKNAVLEIKIKQFGEQSKTELGNILVLCCTLA